MLKKEAIAILNTPKNQYEPRQEIRGRTEQAVNGDDAQLYYDGIDPRGFFEEEFPDLLPDLLNRRHYSVMDVGCGFGRIVPWLTGFDCDCYIGVDPDALRIQFCEARWGGGFRSFSVDTAVSWMGRNPGQQFDVLYCRTVLQHLFWNEKTAGLLSMAELTKPGGSLYIYDGRIWQQTLEECARHYQSPEAAAHMIPMPLAEVEKRLPGFGLTTLGPNFFKFVKQF